ncbi:prephenate dehydratase [Lentibacillus sp. JNUCC-1]|uniref:prephenate dehydratase n=1 Tax=Lentibacillus sp. JNUCC-1 TaxID=2654513 RepID=UPI002F918F5D
MTKIGFLGPKGTFTEMAARTAFPSGELHACKTIPECMEDVVRGAVDYCIVPIENAIEGSVNLTIDYLVHQQALPIVAEVVVPIKQHLMVHPQHANAWQNVTGIHSHPQAISQCHHFLTGTFPDAGHTFKNSTAEAAQWVKNHPEECLGAIGNEAAAQLYGLEIVKWNVHDYNNNHTRFVVLSGESARLELDHKTALKNKTTMIITLPSNFPGALHQVLSAFMWRQINLSKIESRPTKTGLGNYFFIIDADQVKDNVLIPGVQAELEALGCHVSIIGSYPCYSAEERARV